MRKWVGIGLRNVVFVLLVVAMIGEIHLIYQWIEYGAKEILNLGNVVMIGYFIIGALGFITLGVNEVFDDYLADDCRQIVIPIQGSAVGFRLLLVFFWLPNSNHTNLIPIVVYIIVVGWGYFGVLLEISDLKRTFNQIDQFEGWLQARRTAKGETR